MDFSVALSTFILLFLAEMGDKTQLMAMMLAHRFRLVPVIAGVLAAFLVLNLLAVAVGEALFRYVPENLVLSAAGILFLLFAWKSWRDAGEEVAGEETGGGSGSAFLTSFGLLFVAELGDKTQLAMIGMAAGSGDAVAVFLGGTLALWLVSIIGIVLGATVLRRVPQALMHRAAAILFALFGVLALVRVVAGDWA